MKKVVVYDANKIIPGFSDLISAGSLLIEGRKVVIKQKIIM